MLIQVNYNFLLHIYSTVIQSILSWLLKLQTLKQVRLFSTMTEAGAALGVSRTTIKKTIESGKILRDSYAIKLKD